MRIGYGEDAHRLGPGRPLWLGGVRVPAPVGAVAHSDGDVLLHAITDALLSAVAAGDIGALFPNDDPANKDRPSRDFVRAALARVEARGFVPAEVRGTVILDAPKLGPHRRAIAAAVAGLLRLGPEDVGLTFKTSEGLAPHHVQARVVVRLKCL